MTLRALLCLALFAAISGVCPELHAQSITLGSMYTRDRANRPNGAKTTDINYDDCAADDKFNVTLTAVGAASLALEIWVGTVDCSPDTVRANPTYVPSQCWQVYSQLAPNMNSLKIAIVDILPHNDTGQGTGSTAVCDQIASGESNLGNTTTGAGALSMYFVLVNGNQAVGTAPAIPFNFDLRGPDPPTELSMGIGDTRLFPSWTVKAFGDTTAFNAYCEATGNTMLSSTCVAPTLMPGALPPSNLFKGTAAPQGTSIEAAGLENYQEYACGIAGQDKLYNNGFLSELICGIPQDVSGYYRNYRDAGGTAGGGYCAFGRGEQKGVMGSLALGAAAFLVARRRARRRASAVVRA